MSTREEARQRRQKIHQEVQKHVLKPPGATCWVWTGPLDMVFSMPVVYVDNKPVPVKTWLYCRETGERFAPGDVVQFRTSCGRDLGIENCHGLGKRCVNPAHQTFHRVVPRGVVLERIELVKAKRAAERKAA